VWKGIKRAKLLVRETIQSRILWLKDLCLQQHEHLIIMSKFIITFSALMVICMTLSLVSAGDKDDDSVGEL
jgi:hypothetical protein